MTSILRKHRGKLPRGLGILDTPFRRNPLPIWGGIAGLLGALLYGVTQAAPPLADVILGLHNNPPREARTMEQVDQEWSTPSMSEGKR